MRKIMFFCFIIFIEIGNVFASDRYIVTLNKCVDGDTAKFTFNNKIITARFLAIDTPESVHPTKGIEPYGKEASNYTCNKLTNANKIEIEYEINSDKTDKYDRQLVWVWVDDYLLQDEIIKEGLGEVAYLYGDYKYTPLLQDHEKIAKINKLNIWNSNQIKTITNDKEINTLTNNNNDILSIILLIFCLIAFLFSSKFRKKCLKKLNKSFTNIIK